MLPVQLLDKSNLTKKKTDFPIFEFRRPERDI